MTAILHYALDLIGHSDLVSRYVGWEGACLRAAGTRTGMTMRLVWVVEASEALLEGDCAKKRRKIGKALHRSFTMLPAMIVLADTLRPNIWLFSRTV